jgi:hypothetical protein
MSTNTMNISEETIRGLIAALRASDTALRLIQEDASRKQKERLPLIEKMAERQQERNTAILLVKLTK